MKKLSSLLLALVLLLSLAVPAMAAVPKIEYEGHSNFFTFWPGSAGNAMTESDLFDNFKGVMPGDTLSQEITIENSAECCDYIKVYMRADLHDEDNLPESDKVRADETLDSMEDFLSQLSMIVWNGDAKIYEASPDELDGLRTNVFLGTIPRGETLTLYVDLAVPIEMGNAYAFREGEVDWVFTVEEYDNERPDTPKTGDHTTIAPYITMLMVGVFGMFFLFLFKRRKKETD